MKEALQFSLDRKIGDWFLLKEYTIIRVYGFTHEPYIMLSFLTPTLFYLDLVKAKLIVGNEHFISFKKASEIKFPYVIGPIIIKNKAALPVVDILLREIDFKIDFAMKFDPQNVISLRRQMNKNKVFEHQIVEGLVEKYNWPDYPSSMENVEVT